jgi:hypothetical protein
MIRPGGVVNQKLRYMVIINSINYSTSYKPSLAELLQL